MSFNILAFLENATIVTTGIGEQVGRLEWLSASRTGLVGHKW
jgi:hypothetical protein